MAWRYCRRSVASFCALLLAAVASACSHALIDPGSPPATTGLPSTAPAWTNGAVCYEVFVRSFYDSDGDGIGDLNGLIQKLDYINDGSDSPRSLGARCIWLMPVMPSPSYHGYDITDYYHINPQYGTNGDFKRLTTEAHRRGIRVLIDMVLNHTSDQHPAFQAALGDTTSPYRAWYRFAPRPLQNVTMTGGEPVWHLSPVRPEFYYGVFWHGMPDLNYELQPARDEAAKIARFWLGDMGADGFRLDAVPYLVEQGDQLRDTPATHVFLREYAGWVKQAKADAFTVGEVWDSIGLMLTYYPEQLDSYFSFALASDLLGAVRAGNGRGLLADYLRIQATLPDGNYSPFLSNHDQTRVATALAGDVAREKLAATLLLTLPGIPFVYYGEEIGMTGDKPDERIRTPMQWSAGAGAGFTTGTPWEPPQPDAATQTVAGQEADTAALLNLYRQLIHLRSATPALATGALVPLTTPSDAVVAYLRRAPGTGGGAGAVLVVANLGATPLSGVALDAGAAALPAGDYTPATLLGGPATGTMHVDAAGHIQGWVPFPTLAPLAAHVLELRRAGR